MNRYYLMQPIWWFPELKVPPNGCLIVENPLLIDNLGATLIQETICIYIYICTPYYHTVYIYIYIYHVYTYTSI